MAIRIHPDEVAGELRARSRQSPALLRRAMEMAAYRGWAHMSGKTPVDLGQLKNAWRVRKGKDRTVLVNDAPHAGIIEKGARPHPVSREGYEAIYRWVLRHLTYFGSTRTKGGHAKEIADRGWTTHGRGGAQTWDEDPRVAAIARGICGNIKKRGSRATYFTRNEIPHLTKFVGNAIASELAKAARKRASRRASRRGKGK